MSLGRVFVAGHRGMVGSAIVRRLEQGGDATEILTATRDELDLTDQRATFGWLGAPARRGDHRGRQGRRHLRQRHLPGGLHLPEPRDRDQPDPRLVPGRYPANPVPRLELYLPQDGAPAHARRLFINRTARAHERALRDRQDRRDQDVRVL